MQKLYDEKAPKKPTNLNISNDLLTSSRELGINLSATLETALRAELAEYEAKKWSQENKPSIEAYNEMVDKSGCFGDEFRTF